MSEKKCPRCLKEFKFPYLLKKHLGRKNPCKRVKFEYNPQIIPKSSPNNPQIIPKSSPNNPQKFCKNLKKRKKEKI